MCQGLAIIAYKLDDGRWEVKALKGVSSHDDLIHRLDDNLLRTGQRRHLKFEMHFPRNVVDDICQDLPDYYPEGWTEIHFGKRHAAQDAFAAVSAYLAVYAELLELDTSMLQHADLISANLSEANLGWANLSETRGNSYTVLPADYEVRDGFVVKKVA